MNDGPEDWKGIDKTDRPRAPSRHNFRSLYTQLKCLTNLMFMALDVYSFCFLKTIKKLGQAEAEVVPSSSSIKVK